VAVFNYLVSLIILCSLWDLFVVISIQLVQSRCRLFEKAKQNLTVDDDWTLAQTLFGITTFYRRETDGSLSIKLEGSLDGVPLFDQVAVLREVDLHYKWAPFCSSSLTICHLDKLDTVGWFCVGLPHFGLMRDGCFRAIGCDSIYEDGTVLLVAQGIQDRPEDGADSKHLEPRAESPESIPTASTKSSTSTMFDTEEQRQHFEFLSKDPILKKLDIPPPPTRMGSGRMTIRTFQALINIESPTVATSKLVANIDPNLPLIPQSLIDFLMKRLCGVLLSKMQSAAIKISRDPVTNHHAVKMREERDFYLGWLLPKFEGVCQLRGWKMPPLSAFELSETQVDVANALAAKRKHKPDKTILRHAQTLKEDNFARFLDRADVCSFAESEPIEVGHGANSDSGPKIRTRTFDSDDFSDLSRMSSSFASFWGSNPISNYLREIEERTQARKANEIVKSRERAANRLKPKELDEENRARLEELRVARNRRVSAVSEESMSLARLVPPTSTAVPANDAKRSWADFWTKHGILTKLFVMSLLTCSLFGLVYSDVVFEVIVISQQDESFWMSRKRDVATLVYMGAAGLLHFFLCYVALMYAFSALQLGAIAGKQAKKFYSQYVHLIVAIVTTSMIFMGVIQAGVFNACQCLVWQVHLLSRAVEKSVPSLPRTPSVIASPLSALIGVIASILSWVDILFLESNILGRGIRSTVEGFQYVVNSVCAQWTSFVDGSIGEYKGTVASIPWRKHAFLVTRALLSYSAIFLMVLLFLFNLTAWRARSVEEDTSEDYNSKATAKADDTTSSKGKQF
jgi:hypothetical protein